MKKLLSVLPSTLQGGFRGGLLFLALLVNTTLWAYDFQSGDLYYNITSDSTVEVTDGSYSGEVIIPETVTYNGVTYSVTRIGERAFYNSSITSVTIPASVISLQEYSFYESKYIKTVYLKSTTPPILNGGKIFDTSRPTCYIPCGTLDTYKASEWANLMKQFVEECEDEDEDSTNIITYTSSDGKVVQPYETDAFGANIVSNEYKDGQGVITFDGRVRIIGYYAFYKRSALTSITIPNSVRIIGEAAFSLCSALTSITIPNSVTSIESYAFSDCSSLTSITIPESVTSIGTFAFRSCKSLTSVTIPNSVTSIGDYAFYGCSGLTSITIPNSVTSIGAFAFRSCKSLTSVTIPNSVTSIGSRAFSGCSGLTSIIVEGGNAIYDSRENCNAIVETTTNTLIVGCQSTIIPESVTSIGDYAFRNCQSLTSITIPNSVTSIGYDAFYGCSALTSITCEAMTPPTLGSDVFYQVSKSIPVYVPCGCVSAYKAAKYWMDFTNIQEPQVEYSIQVDTSNSQMGSAKVDYNTYCDGNQISATANNGYHFVQWSDGVTDNPRTLTLTQDTVLTAEFALTTAGQCGKSLYWVYDTNKSTLTITGSGDMYNERPWGLFANDLTEVALPEGLTHIGDGAFVDCINLKAITIPASVTSIGANSFAGCRRIRDVYCYPLMPPYAEATSFANYNANLNVPCDFLEDYQYDPVFGSFKYFICMGAESDNTDSDEVVITPGTTDVTIVWPTEEDADTYSIVIYKDGRVFCTLTFNANGQLLNIAFAPGRDGNRPAQYAEQVANGYRFTVTGLTESTKYEYNITTKDESDNTISTHSGEFTTKSNTPTDLENNDIQYPISDTRKLLRDGQLYIYHNGSTYTIMGAEIQ